MKRLTDQERKWCKIMETSTSPTELIETAQKLKMKPLSLEKAKELVELNKRVLSLHIEADKRKTRSKAGEVDKAPSVSSWKLSTQGAKV